MISNNGSLFDKEVDNLDNGINTINELLFGGPLEVCELLSPLSPAKKI